MNYKRSLELLNNNDKYSIAERIEEVSYIIALEIWRRKSIKEVIGIISYGYTVEQLNSDIDRILNEIKDSSMINQKLIHKNLIGIAKNFYLFYKDGNYENNIHHNSPRKMLRDCFYNNKNKLYIERFCV